MMRKTKNRINRLKRNIKKAPLSSYVVLSLVMVVVFTITMTIIFCIYQTIPDTLVTCWYSCWAGECLLCALIKMFKLKGENNGLDN